MLKIKTAIRDLLLADKYISRLVGSRINVGRTPEGSTGLALVLSHHSMERFYALDGSRDPVVQGFIDVDAYQRHEFATGVVDTVIGHVRRVVERCHAKYLPGDVYVYRLRIDDDTELPQPPRDGSDRWIPLHSLTLFGTFCEEVVL